MTDRRYKAKERKIRKHNKTVAQKEKLRKMKKRYKLFPNFRLPSTSKLVLLVSALFCAEIIIFSEYAIMKLGSNEALYTLIGAPIAIVPIIISYYNKSKAENTSGGLVYDSAMSSLDEDDSEEELNSEDKE